MKKHINYKKTPEERRKIASEAGKASRRGEEIVIEPLPELVAAREWLDLWKDILKSSESK